MEQWAAGDAYAQYMEQWNQQIAQHFVTWLDPAAQATWLDVSDGTGALTAAGTSPTALTVSLAPSLDLVKHAHRHITQARFTVADTLALPLVDEAFDYVLSGLTLNLVSQPQQALAEWRRVTKPGGIIAAYVWDYADKMEFLRYFWDAAAAVDINAKPFHEGERFPLCTPEPLRQLWQEAALTAVEVQALETTIRFDNFDAYWQPFTAGHFPAPQYVASLDAYMRANLQAQLRGTLPFAADGSLELIARAWAVRGTKTA